MDSSILHKRIQEYKSKAAHPVSKEMILLFESWFLSIENYISEIELHNFNLDYKNRELIETIDILTDLLIISGNADKLLLDLKDESIKKSIKLLLQSKDRKNHNSIIAISALINLHNDITSTEQLKNHA